ncbi:ladinin-1 [Lagopus leucura]|uniref:ladinin-1 n=1 Tax=Lagopus leucura TaxID=30410 RepID=UPI001C663991|nr:ladinin-1 [Lagopus leucura]XP_042743081.1 ladinin-1 [Lagopus leucura]
MSFSRRNWSDLSSLARQRTLEDEEEQQRERRRRHRSLLSSSSVDEDHPSPGKDPSPAPSRPQAPVKPMAPEEGEERKLTEVLRTKEGRRMRSPMAVSEKPKQEKEQQEAGMKPHEGQESITATERGQDTAPAPAGEQHPVQSHERKVTARGRLQDREGSSVGTLRGEQRREEEQQRVAPELGGCRLREVKILTRTRSSSTEEKAASEGTSPPAQQKPPRNPSKEGMQPPPSQEEPTEKRDAPPAPATYSTSIRRSSPRTVSFRVISNKQKEESESPLARSASMRIPGSSSSIEEKLEKYTSAVQRSGSVRSSLTVQKSLMLTSEGVASKRNFFEASAPSKAEPLTARKDNLKIPGSVTSRINLWISRTQEPAKEEKSKDIRKINSLPRRDGWVKQPRETPADPEL